MFDSGVDFASGLTEEIIKKGEKNGCLEVIFGFIIGAFFRLPFALIMIPVQALFSLVQRRTKDREETGRILDFVNIFANKGRRYHGIN